MRIQTALILAVALTGVVAAACTGGDDGPRRTQISQVNAVIDRVIDQDRAGVADLLQFTSLPCTDGPANGDQPACEGEAPGTNIDVFQANECENRWLRRDDVEPLLDQLVAMEPVVYAAFVSPEGFYLPGRYAVIFEGNDGRTTDSVKRYVSVGVEGNAGFITGIAFGCSVGEPVHFLLPHVNDGFDAWLIEPKSR